MASPLDQFNTTHSRATEKSSYLSRSVIATWLAAFAFIAILIAGWVHTKATVESQLREQVLAMSQLSADRTALTFDSIAKTLQTISDGLQAVAPETARELSAESRMAFQTMLIRARSRHHSLVALTIADSSGRPLASSPFHSGSTIPLIRPQDIPSLSQDDLDSPAISAPFRDPTSGAWLVRMTQRIGSQSNLAANILVADVAIDEALSHFFRHYPFDAGDVAALRDAADRELAIFPAGHGPIGGPEQDGGVGNAIAAEPSTTVRYLLTPNSGETHLVASRKLPRYPFYIVYGKNVDGWLTRWRQERFALLAAALAALIVTTGITAGIQRRHALTSQLQKVRGDLEDSNAALRATLSASELLASRDQMTGLLNRRTFDRRLEASIARATRHGDTFSLLMLDIDHFKNTNDYYGHATGDDVLRRFGEVLSERLRQNDVAARWGGEEFVVLADGTNLDNARMLAEQIRESVAMTPFSPVPRVTVSIGLAQYQMGETGDDLLKRADKALYGAKRNGRNRVIAAESAQTLVRQSA